MSNFFKAALMFFVIIFTLASYAETSSIQFTDPKQPIVVAKSSPQFTIRLASNPTTGFAWFVQSSLGNDLTLTNHMYHPPQKNLPGAPGYEEWTYQINPSAIDADQINMAMIYARPWELNDAKLVKFKIQLQ